MWTLLILMNQTAPNTRKLQPNISKKSALARRHITAEFTGMRGFLRRSGGMKS